MNRWIQMDADVNFNKKKEEEKRNLHQCMTIYGCSLPQIACWQTGWENIMTAFVVQYRRFGTCGWKWL